MAEKQKELESQLLASKRENKELKEKRKSRDENLQADSEEVDSEEINMKVTTPDKKGKEKNERSKTNQRN